MLWSHAESQPEGMACHQGEAEEGGVPRPPGALVAPLAPSFQALASVPRRYQHGAQVDRKPHASPLSPYPAHLHIPLPSLKTHPQVGPPLTASPLSPLLPLCPGVPTSPCRGNRMRKDPRPSTSPLPALSSPSFFMNSHLVPFLA